MPGCGCRGDGVTGFLKNTAPGVCGKYRSRGLLGFAKNKLKKTTTLNGLLCRLHKLRTEQNIQTAEVKVKRM